MKERPIIFSAPMVRAILEGRKTMTRRVIKPQPPEETPHFRGTIGSYSGAVRPYFFWGRFANREDWLAYMDRDDHDPDKEEDIVWPGGDSDGFTCDWHASTSGMLCPYGASENPFRSQGDRLWVREAYFGNHFLHPNEPENERELHYRADGLPDFEGEESQIRWRPSIHMPRWASRILLEITGVRVERVQDISEADAVAEGVIAALTACTDGMERDLWYGVDHAGHESPIPAYADLWESISNPRGLCPDDVPHCWDANPWVWV